MQETIVGALLEGITTAHRSVAGFPIARLSRRRIAARQRLVSPVYSRRCPPFTALFGLKAVTSEGNHL